MEGLQKLLLLILSLGFVAMSANYTFASPVIVISELQLGDETSAKSEYVEISNLSNKAVSLQNVTIEYRSATGTKWSNKIDSMGAIAANGSYIFATEEYGGASDEYFSGGFAGSGGGVRLGIEGSYFEEISWGSEDFAAPDSSQVVRRFASSTGVFAVTGKLLNDFYVSSERNPVSTQIDNVEAAKDFEVIVEKEDSQTNTATATKDDEIEDIELVKDILERSTPKNYHQIVITEALPDPTTPFEDKKDEFIELYNPHDFAVNIDGYAIKVGSSFSRSFVLPAITMNAGQYLTLYSENTGLSLSNSGSAIKITDPQGQDLFEVPEYSKAEAGQSYALQDDGEWAWTESLTPSKPNSKAVVDTEESEGVEELKEDEESSLADDIAGAEERDYGEFNEERNIYEEPEEASSSSFNIRILAAFIGVAVSYSVWEYKDEIQNTLQNLKRH